MNRMQFEEFVSDSYGVCADHPFEKYPSISAFRHKKSGKWFALIMSVDKRKLGMSGEGVLDIVNLKCTPDMVDSFVMQKGIYRAYHMSKMHWVSIALDGSADDENITFLTEVSYTLTRTSKSAKYKKGEM